MFKLYGSLLLFFTGFVIAIGGYFFVWVAGMADYSVESTAQYQRLALGLIILAIVIMLTGIALSVITVRNRRKKQYEKQLMQQRRDD